MAEVLRVARRQFVKNGYRATRMEDIAAAADVAKRTLYLWHKDKAALFLACVLEGASRFPPLDLDHDEDPGSALAEFGAALAREYSAESNYGMGLLIMREASDFPELATASEEAQRRYVIEPLAAYLRRQGFEEPRSHERTDMLIAMMLAKVHAALIAGARPPDPAAAERTARQAVELFVRGAGSLALRRPS